MWWDFIGVGVRPNWAIEGMLHVEVTEATSGWWKFSFHMFMNQVIVSDSVLEEKRIMSTLYDRGLQIH